MKYVPLFILLLSSFSVHCISKEFYREVLIEGPSRGDDVGVINGIDDYQVERYKGYDRTVRPQKQEELRAQREDPTPYWQFYRNDYDSYQERQTERFIQWQKRVGIRPQRY